MPWFSGSSTGGGWAVFYTFYDYVVYAECTIQIAGEKGEHFEILCALSSI